MNRTEEILKLAEKYRAFTAEKLSELVKAVSMSGDEKVAADILAGQMRDAGFDEVSIDPLGNVIGRIGSG
ncbi:MAG: YgeY family selenium metabolism-linked hydrolase, partial [Candidatus Aminicenantes bacterium]|nr:YgeY family selenium metabolism-linked hydrolase [Candidatus Aminicenantes bacterium]